MKRIPVFLRYFNMPPFTPMLTQPMLFYLKRPKPGNNSGANYPRELKFCTRPQVSSLHNIMKRIPVFLRYFNMPPFTPMLTQPMLFYLKRPKPGNNSGANYPRELKFCTRPQVSSLHNIMKRIPVFLRYFNMPPFTPMLTQPMLFYLKRPKPGNNSGANYPRELKFCTRPQVSSLHNIMKRIPVFLRYFNMPPFTPMLTQPMLFYLKRPKPWNNSGANYPRELKFCTRPQVSSLHNIMKRIPVFLRYFNMPPFTPMLTQPMLFYLKRPKPGNNSGANYPRELKFCTRPQVSSLHNIMKRIPVFLRYFNMPPFTPMLTQPMLFYLKRPKPWNNSGANYPRELKFCTRPQVSSLHNIMKRIPVFLRYFNMPPFTPMLTQPMLFYLKRPKPWNNSGANYPRELKFCTRPQVSSLHNIMKRIPVFLRYFNMPPFTPMLTQPMLFYLKRPKPWNNSGANYPRELKFCTRPQVSSLHNIMKRIPVFLRYFNMPPFTPMLTQPMLFYLKRPKPGNNSGANYPRELKFCTRPQVSSLHNIMKRIPVFLRYFNMPPFTPMLTQPMLFYLKRPKPGNNSGANYPRELKFCTRPQVSSLHNIMKRIPVFLRYFNMPPFTPMLTQPMLFYLKRPKPGNNSGANYPRELKFCTRPQVSSLHNIMKRIPVFLRYFNMPPFTPMLTQPMLFYLKRPKPGNNSGANYPRELKFCTRPQVSSLHNIMKRIPVFLRYFNMPPFTPMLTQPMLFYLKRPKPGNNSGANYPRELKFCTRPQVSSLHNIMKRIPVFLRYFNMPPFTPMLTQPMLFYLKRPKPWNNSGANYPRELKFCTRPQVSSLHNIMKRIPVFLRYFNMPPFTPMLTQPMLFYLKRPKPWNNSGANYPRELKFCTRPQVSSLHNIMKRIPVFLRYFNMPPFTPMLTQPMLFYLKRPKPGNNSGANYPRELKFCTRPQVSSLHNIMKRIPVFLRYFNMPPFTPMLTQPMLFYLKRPKPGNNSGANYPRELKFCTRPQVSSLHNIMKRIPVFLRYFNMPPFTPMLTQPMLFYLKRPKPGNNSGANYPRELKFCTRPQVSSLHNIMKRIPVFLRYFNMPPFTPMLTQPMLFYLKRPKPWNNSGANYPRELKFCTRPQVSSLHNIMKRIPVFLRYFNMPPFTPMLTQPMLFYLKRPKPGNNSGANYPRELKFCTRPQVSSLHNIMKRIPVFLRYFNMPPFTPMLTQPMLFYLKRPKPWNNSGANYPRELKFCTRPQVSSLHNIMKRIPVFLRYFNMPPFTPMLTQPMLFYLKRPKPGNNSGANYPRELKFCTRPQVSSLHNIMKRIPVFLRYFNMPPFTPMLTQPMLFYLKRPKPWNNSGANYPRELKFCTRPQVSSLHNIMKRIPVFLRYFNMPPFTPMLTQPMLFYLKRPKPGNNSGANYPRELKFCTRPQVSSLHNIMKRIPVFLRYFNMPPFTPMLTQPMLFYLKRPKPWNNSGANYPRELKFCTRPQVSSLHNIMKRIPVFLRYFNMPPFTPMLTQPMLFYLKRPKPWNNSGANYPRELKFCTRPQVSSLHNIMKRIPVFLRYFNMPPFTPMLTQPMLFYLKRPKPGNNSGANYPRELKFCTRPQVSSLHNIMKRIPVFLRYFNMPPFTPMLTQPMLFYLKRPKPGNNSGANYPRELKFCTRPQVSSLHNIMKRIPVFLRYFNMPPFTPMLTQPMLFYLKRPKPGNNSGANYPRELKFCTRPQVSSLHNIMKRIPVFLRYFNMPPFTPMLTQPMLFYLKRPKPGNNSGANYPRELKFCTRPQVSSLHNIMKRIPVFLRYFNMPPFTPMLTQPMLFYLKRPKPWNNSGANYPRELKFCTRPQVSSLHNIMKRIPVFLRYFNMPPFTPMLTQPMLFYLKRPKPGNNSGANYPRELKFCTRPQVSSLHNIMKRIPVFLRYFNMPPFTPMLTQPMLFYLKRPKPWNNSGANYPRELKFCTRPQVSSLHNIMKRIPVFLRYFNMPPFTPMLTQPMLFYLKRPKPGNNSGANYPRELKFCTRPQVSSLHNIMKRIPVFLRYFNMPPFTPMLTQPMLFYLKRPKPGNNSGANYPRELKFCTRPQVSSLHNIMKRIPVFLRYFNMPPFTPMLTQPMLFYLKRPKPGNNSGANYPRELKFCTRPQVSSLHNIMKRIPVFLRYFNMPPFTPMLTQPMLFYLKRPKPGNNSGANYPRELKFCTRPQVSSLHNIMKRIPVFLRYFNMPPFTPMLTQPMLFYLKRPKPWNNSGANYPRELKFCTRPQVSSLHNIMKRIPVFLRYFNMPPFTPMLTQPMLFYLKRPKPWNNSGANYPRELKFCTRPQVSSLHNIMKRIPVFLRYFNMPPFTPMLTQPMLFYLKRPKPGNNSGANYPRELKFCTRPQVSSLHNIMKRIPVFLRYFNMPPFTPMLTQPMLFYLKRPKPWNNSGANYPRELKFCTRPQVSSLHNIMKRIPVFLRYFNMPPFTPMLTQPMLFYLKRPKPGNNSGANYPRELKFCTRPQVSSLHNIMKRIPVFLRYFNMPPFTPMLTQPMLFYLKRPKPGNNSGANYPRELKFCTRPQVSSLHNIMKRIPVFLRYFNMPPFTPMLTQPMLFYLKRPKPGNNSGANYPRELKFCTRPQVSSLHNIMKRIPVFLRYFNMPPFTPMLTQPMLFYLKRPKPGNNSGANYPRELKFCTRPQVSSLHNIMKRIPVFLRYFNMPPFTPMLTQPMLFYLKRPKPGITPVQIIPENSNFAQDLRLVPYTIL